VLGHSQVFWSEISGDNSDEIRNGYPKGKVTPGRITALMRKYDNLYCDLSAGSGMNAMMRDKEHAVSFFREFADRILYGCDICQEACPWNQSKRKERIDPHLLMPAELCALSPQNLDTLSQEEFEQLFATSPIRRIGVPHLQRNLEEILRRQEG
jgi:hypothetical protein